MVIQLRGFEFPLGKPLQIHLSDCYEISTVSLEVVLADDLDISDACAQLLEIVQLNSKLRASEFITKVLSLYASIQGIIVLLLVRSTYSAVLKALSTSDICVLSLLLVLRILVQMGKIPTLPQPC